eukprot:scaffold30495_cov71-Phaeocystis_antarctica.AAC.3
MLRTPQLLYSWPELGHTSRSIAGERLRVRALAELHAGRHGSLTGQVALRRRRQQAAQPRWVGATRGPVNPPWKATHILGVS